MHVLALCCDLTPDGRALGEQTLVRLRHAVSLSKKNKDIKLVVATPKCPDFPDLQVPVSRLMAEWIREQGVECLELEGDAPFNTRGELQKFFEQLRVYERGVLSAPWHLRRTKVIIRQMFGANEAKRIKYFPVHAHKLTTRMFFLELLKWVHIMLPRQLRNPAVHLYRLLWGRSSW